MHYEHNHKKQNIQKLKLVLGLTVFYMFAEFIGGYFANSLALMADASHMLSDAVAIGIAIFAVWFSMKPATFEKTFGYHRIEIFAAFINGVMLFVIAGFIIYEAFQRIANPPDVNAPILIFVALGGLFINIIAAWILGSANQKSLNIKGIYLHVLGDMLGSFGAVISGVAIYFFDLYILDPVISFIIAALILFSAVRLVSETTEILLEASPAGVDVEKIYQALLNLPDVKDIHHLHVWSITYGKILLSVHIVTESSDFEQVLLSAQKLLKNNFKINHVTIQIESPDFKDEKSNF